MSEAMNMMIEFHRAFELPMNREPKPVRTVEADIITGRVIMQVEETHELELAIDQARRGAGPAYGLVGIADALADIVYVAYGTALTLGIDLDAALAEVHRSNMTKLDSTGHPIKRGDGKVVKGPNYEKPDLRRVLLEQRPLW